MSRGAKRVLAVVAVVLILGIAATRTGTLVSQDGSEKGSATVEWVVDGDTMDLVGGDTVRLVQIDTPEVKEGECYAEDAKRELIRLAPKGTSVELEDDPRLDAEDRYGRLLRYVHANRTNLNVELVRLGAAAPYFHSGVRGAYASELMDAVDEARAARRGMWGECRVSWSPNGPVDTRSR